MWEDCIFCQVQLTFNFQATITKRNKSQNTIRYHNHQNDTFKTSTQQLTGLLNKERSLQGKRSATSTKEIISQFK